MIQITGQSQLDEHDLRWEFVRASGPGGQHVNKSATAAQLRFNVRENQTLHPAVRRRLILLATNKINTDGELLIDARQYRSQKQNRQDALSRLAHLIRRAEIKPRIRRKTKPTLASKHRRLDQKKRRSDVKKLRGKM